MPTQLRPLDSAIVPRFSDVATFMRTPRRDSLDGVDIALVGVPFDMGSTNRAGPRHGPAQIREMSRLIRQVNPSTHIAPFDLCNVADYGDAPVNPLDPQGSIDRIADFYNVISAAGVRPISAGGDHTVVLPILRGIASREHPVSVVHFDAHADTMDELLGSKINHATPFRRAHEEGLLVPEKVIQIGLRGTRYSDEDIQYGYDAGFRIVTMDDFEEMGRAAVIEAIKETVGSGPTYITFDIDGLDPIYCPGTGAPEPGGLFMRDVQVILRALSMAKIDIVGGDVCEVAPALDQAGHTALNAANIMFEMLCGVAASIDRLRATQ